MLLVSEGAHLCLQQPSIFIFWQSPLNRWTYRTASSTLQHPSNISSAIVVCRHKTAVSVCLWLFYWCDTDCVFFVFGCLLSNVKLCFFYEFWVLFSGQKGDYASSKSVLYSFDPTGRVDMGTISCTISHLSQFSFFLLYLCDSFRFCYYNVPEWNYQQVFCFLSVWLILFFSLVVLSRAPDFQARSSIQQALMLRMWHA